MYKELKRKFNSLPLIQRSILTGLLVMVEMFLLYILMVYFMRILLISTRIGSVFSWGIYWGLITYAKEANISKLHKNLLYLTGIWLVIFSGLSLSSSSTNTWGIYALAALAMSLFGLVIIYLFGPIDKS